MAKIKSAFSGVGQLIGRHKKLAIALGIALVLAVVLMVRGGLAAPSMANLPDSLSYVRTVTLTKGSLDESISASGTVASDDVSNVTTDLKYTVKEINVQVGDSVQEGDVICTLDTTDLLKSIAKEKESMSDAVGKAKKAYTEAQEAYDEALAEVTEAYDAMASKKTSRDKAKSAFDKAKADVAGFQTAYDKANADLLAKMQAEQKARDKALDEAKTNLANAENALSAAQTALDNLKTNTPDDAAAIAAAEAAVTAAEKKKNEASDDVDAKTAAAGSAAIAAAAKDAETALQFAQSNLSAAKNSVNYTALENAYSTADSAHEQAKASHEQAVKSAEASEKSRDTAKEAYDKAGDSDQLEALQEELEKCTLKAETSGKVTGISAIVGSVITGDVATIQNTTNLKIGISIAEYDIEKVTTGMKAIITSDVIDGEVEGVLTQISPTATGGGASSSSFAAEVSVTGTDSGLLIGTNAKVKIVISTTDDVYSVPLDAVGQDEDGNDVVYVQAGTDESGQPTFEPVRVQCGTQNDYFVEISGSTLAEGMVVRAAADADEASEEMQLGNMQGGMGFGAGQVTVVEGAEVHGGMDNGGPRTAGGGMIVGG